MKRIFTKPVFMRASVMLLMTMLTSVGAWAQASMLMTDTEEPLGSAARHYVLMPVNDDCRWCYGDHQEPDHHRPQ